MREGLKLNRSGLVAGLVAAAVSLLTSPVLAVWSLVAGVGVAAVGLLAVRWAPRARLAFFAGAGLAVGAVPYLILAVVSGVFGDPSGSSGSV